VSDYVDGVLQKFIARYDGQYLDHSHAYGPQSPDLIEYYLTELLGRPWQFRAGAAALLWEDWQAVMTDFERIERGPQKQVSVDFQPGDVLVFSGGMGDFGTVGIYVRPGSRVGSVQMFTQNPGPAKVIDIMADGYVHKLLGGWRLTYGAECRIMVDKFAQQMGHEAWAQPQPDPLEAHWKVEGATPEAKALIEEVMTDEVMRSVERDAADEAGRRMLYGATCPPGDLSAYDAYLKPGVIEKGSTYFASNPAEPGGGHWMQAVSVTRTDEELPYGHTEIVTKKKARHYRRQTLKARLLALIGRGPK